MLIRKMLSVLLSISLVLGLCFCAAAEGSDPVPAVTEALTEFIHSLY